MTRQDIAAWVDRYVHAWETNDPADISGLFTPDADYFTAPFRPPWHGQEAIVAGWLDLNDQPGTWTFRYEVLGVDGDLGFVRGWTRYLEDNSEFSNLWVIRLDNAGLCSSFTEWWMENKPET